MKLISLIAMVMSLNLVNSFSITKSVISSDFVKKVSKFGETFWHKNNSDSEEVIYES